MAYTIDYTYDKILRAIDKDGSDFFSIPHIMKAFESATYDFVEEEYQQLGRAQFVTDVLKPLYKPFITSAPSITDYISKVTYKVSTFVLPNDYLHLYNIKTTTGPGIKSRKVFITDPGKLESKIVNPNNRPTDEYPLLILLTNTFNVYSINSIASFNGFYLKKPTFGNVAGATSTEISVDLEDFVIEKIIKITANNLLIQIGDPRAQLLYREEKEFGKV